MYITDNEFNEKYKDKFTILYDQYAQYVSQSDNLKHKSDAEIDPLHASSSNSGVWLPEPKPDPFMYRLIRYKGFVKYPERLKNFIVAREDGKSHQRAFFPVIMDIEPNTRCNFRCIMCQHSEWGKGKRVEDMHWDDFKNFIDRQYGLTEVKLQGMGEPLLHDDFIRMVRYLVDRFIWVRTTVNGSLLHVNNNYKRLVDSGINEVQTSFDGTTKSVFEDIRKGADFKQVVRNLTLLNEYADSKSLLLTRMWVLLHEKNKNQMTDFIEIAHKMKFKRLTFSIGLGDWGQQKIRDKLNKIRLANFGNQDDIDQIVELGRSYGIEVTFWNLSKKYSTKTGGEICNWPFSRAYVSADLRIVPCCMIGNPDVAQLGDAREFEAAWNGQAYRKFRNAHLNGNIPDFCRNCYE